MFIVLCQLKNSRIQTANYNFYKYMIYKNKHLEEKGLEKIHKMSF